MDKDCLPIKEQEIALQIGRADRWLVQVSRKPKAELFLEKEKQGDRLLRTDFSEKTEETISLIRFAQELSASKTLLSDDVHFLLSRMRQGIALGLHLGQLYAKVSGLENLLAQKQTYNNLSSDQITECREKYRTTAMVTIFAAARFMKYELQKYRTEEAESIILRFDGIPELDTSTPNLALDCMVFYLGMYLEKSGRVKTGLEMVKMALLYFTAFLEECVLQTESLKYAEMFTGNRYRLENSEFEICGFDASVNGGAASIEFNRVTFGDIVGNQVAKHKALRLVTRLCCYDPESRANPMKDLGALPILRSGFGDPGTGKGMHISATATLLQDRVPGLVGIPFLFHPMPQSMVDSYQGNSGKRMHEWFKPMRDPTKIVYAPIDDAEQNLTDRSRRDCSAGQLELVQEFLPGVEGPLAIWKGNAVLEIFTNLPEKLDPAVLSRIQDRFELKGAVRIEDFIDMDHLWLSRYEKLDAKSDFINMKDPHGYRYLDAQKLVASMSKIVQIEEPQNPKLAEIFRQVEKKNKVSERMYFADLYDRSKKEWPAFSPRDQRNIQNAVNERVYDFDFPEEWINDPGKFFRIQPNNYQEKVRMISALAKDNLKGFSFAQVWRQEVIRYLDTWLLIKERGRERAIKEAMTRMEEDYEARRRLQTMIKTQESR